ncbi:hypothetical protein PVAP13_2KG261058 [Panicum virgatum]|uniref:Uncharacterized protein n=1 Tax=Panicum virgatum TaxID=38727 RepID=A0A8T0W1C6_PANVG|nr:hypothetical protein PVAP13_2KG261058 [Panicum virgatum]
MLNKFFFFHLLLRCRRLRGGAGCRRRGPRQRVWPAGVPGPRRGRRGRAARRAGGAAWRCAGPAGARGARGGERRQGAGAGGAREDLGKRERGRRSEEERGN